MFLIQVSLVIICLSYWKAYNDFFTEKSATFIWKTHKNVVYLHSVKVGHSAS